MSQSYWKNENTNMIWEVFKIVIFHPANNRHKVWYKTGDLTFDQGRITHNDIDLVCIRRVCLSNNCNNNKKGMLYYRTWIFSFLSTRGLSYVFRNCIRTLLPLQFHDTFSIFQIFKVYEIHSTWIRRLSMQGIPSGLNPRSNRQTI